VLTTKYFIDFLETSIPLAKAARKSSRGMLRWPLVLRFALRDFRGGLRGFAIFLASIALGVAAIYRR
jgi:putative ABC transport system permease protein